MAKRISQLTELPRAPGAYALIVRLDAPLILNRRRWQSAALAPGQYVYCGSALGPGGILARLTRHARRNKPRHWHVDELTGAGRVVAAAGFTGESECGIMDRISALRGMQIPIEGFGSSDCRHCAAHLALLPGGIGPARLLSRLSPDAIWLAE
jgi:Uri superfamily endonuclease